MKAIDITPTMQFATFYGNGKFIGNVTVTRVTASSVFVATSDKDSKYKGDNERREGITSVQRYLDKGSWKPINQ